MLDLDFFINSFLLGVGLAMDAFSVSLANGMNEPLMKKRKGFAIAGVFGLFQGLMPFIGWICVHTVLNYFNSLQKLIPYIALLLLSFIGLKMIFDKKEEGESGVNNLVFGALIVQAIATSIDALSVGFTIANYKIFAVLVAGFLVDFLP